jgi:hypothetical protein
MGTTLNWTPTTGWAVVVGDNTPTLYDNYSYSGALEDINITGPGAGTNTGAIYIGGSDGIAGTTGTLSTSGTAVTGTGFNTAWTTEMPIWINGASYQIASVTSSTALTLVTSAGTQTNVAYTVVGSPSQTYDPIANQGDHFNFNRVRIVQLISAGAFGVGIQFGANAWSNTFFQCVIASGATGVYIPASITTLNSGGNLLFLGSSISNNHGIGVLCATGNNVVVSLVSCSLDYNGNFSGTGKLNNSWAVQNGAATSQNIINMVNCYVTNPDHWIQSYGDMSIANCCFTDGSNSGTGTLKYLIDNQGPTFNINGGQFFNGGTGYLLNPAGVGA